MDDSKNTKRPKLQSALEKKARPDFIKVDYKQIEADPEEIESRLKEIYAVIFEEVMRRRKAVI